MDHRDLVDAVAASMAQTKAQKSIENNVDEPNEKFEEMEHMGDEMRKEDESFIIHIPMVTGRVFKVDSREVDWDQLGTPESQANLENNEGIIRGMVYHLITADFTNSDTDKMLTDFDESLTNLFKNFGIEDCGYSELKENMCSRHDIITNVKRDMLEACIDTNDIVPACDNDNDDKVFKINEYISKTYRTKYDIYAERLSKHALILGKCFDALTLINVIAHNVAIHGLATKIFRITDSFKEVADLNDITDMDNSTGGLISEDRTVFEGIDDHDVSGLVTE